MIDLMIDVDPKEEREPLHTVYDYLASEKLESFVDKLSNFSCRPLASPGEEDPGGRGQGREPGED